jgi:hypothetical protein
MVRTFFLRLAALLLSLVPVPAWAASVGASPKPTAVVTINFPASLSKLQDMDFGSFSVTTAGTAVLDSNTDAVTTTGGVLRAGGLPHAARFSAVSPTKNIVKIALPKSAVTLTRVGGPESMTIDTFNINGATTRNVVAHEVFTFQVGGTLHVGANQVEGLYTGSFDVTLTYN